MSDHHEKTDADGYAMDELLFFVDNDIDSAQVALRSGNLDSAKQALIRATKDVARAIALKELENS